MINSIQAQTVVPNNKQQSNWRPSRRPIVIALGGALAAMAGGASLAQSTDSISTPVTTTYTPQIGFLELRVETIGSVHTTTGPAIEIVNPLAALTNAGTIISDIGAGVVNGLDIGSPNTIGTLNNRGYLYGGDSGVRNNGLMQLLQVTAAGQIDGGGAGLDNRGTITYINNLGSITGTSFGIDNGGAAVGGAANAALLGGMHNQNLIAGNVGIRSSGTITGFENASTGRIEGTEAAVLIEAGGIGTLVNHGVITSPRNAIENHSTAAGMTSLFNYLTGTIVGTVQNLGEMGVDAYAIENYGKMDAIDNRGLLTGVTAGIGNIGTGVISEVSNSGRIGFLTAGGLSARGIENLGTIGQILNSGTIGGQFVAIGNVGKLGDIENAGTIASENTAIENYGDLSRIVNRGVISGLTAIDNLANVGELRIQNEGTIRGNIVNATPFAMTITGGGSAFGTIGGANGGIGYILSQSADVHFTKGNLVLNSNVDAVTNTVHNSGATLLLHGERTITGNYIQGADATLKIGVSDPSQYGSQQGGISHLVVGPQASANGTLVVNGTATFETGSSVNLEKYTAYTFAAGQRFVVVDAATAGSALNHDGLKYSVTGYAPGAKGTQTIVGDRSYLVVTLANGEVVPADPDSPSDPTDPTNPANPTEPANPATPAPPPAARPTDPTAISSLAGLGRYTGVDNAQLLNLFNAGQALTNGSVGQANSAGKQLSPVSQTSTMRAAVAPTYDALKVIASRTDANRIARANGVSGSGISTGERAYQWAGWGQAFGGHASQDDRGGYDGYRANYGGLLIGADRLLNEQWTVGGAFSYANTSLDATGDTSGNRTRINAYGVLGYAGYTAGTWYANLSAGAMLQRYDTTRNVAFTGFSGTANGEFNGQQYVARLEGGYPLAVGRFTVTPLGSLIYSYLRQSAYSETGGNGAALNVGAANTSSVRSLVGAKLERGFQTASGLVTPYVQLQWSHEYNRSRQSLASGFSADPSGSTLFTTVGPRPVGDLAVFNVGATLLKGNNLSLTARYGLEAGSGFMSHTGSLQVRRLF